MKWVFISHPYKSDPEQNEERANRICKKIAKQYDNVLPISPLHLFSFCENDVGVREEIMNVLHLLLVHCDELWQFGNSEGCQKEVQWAKTNGVTVKDGNKMIEVN